jgi:hypothetical protein
MQAASHSIVMVSGVNPIAIGLVASLATGRDRHRAIPDEPGIGTL